MSQDSSPRPFAFVIHPMNVRRDASRKYPILKFFPESAVEALMLKISPKLMGTMKGIQSLDGTQAEGWLVGCPLGTRQLQELPPEKVYDKLEECGHMAAKLGAKVMGLGAYTSVAGDAGITVAKRLEGVISVTSGNSYTVYTAIEGLMHAAKLMEVDVANSRAAIIGATGSIGAVCAQMLAPQVAHLALIGRDTQKLEVLREKLEGQDDRRATMEVATDIGAALRQSDLVLAVSAAGKELVFPQDLKIGAVVCDVARPRDVSQTVIEQRDDVLVIEGGVIDVPGQPDWSFDFGFPQGTAYACMSETMMLALEGSFESYTLGRELTREQVERTGQWANKHGFKLAGFRAFEHAVTEEHIEQIKNNARRKMAAKKPTVESSPGTPQSALIGV